MSCYLLTATAVVVSITGAVTASAEPPSNPLQPSYYAAKTVGVNPITMAGSARYVDSHNPMHPAFARAGDAGRWYVARFASTRAYVDANNPLHPKFTHN